MKVEVVVIVGVGFGVVVTVAVVVGIRIVHGLVAEGKGGVKVEGKVEINGL